MMSIGVVCVMLLCYAEVHSNLVVLNSQLCEIDDQANVVCGSTPVHPSRIEPIPLEALIYEKRLDDHLKSDYYQKPAYRPHAVYYDRTRSRNLDNSDSPVPFRSCNCKSNVIVDQPIGAKPKYNIVLEGSDATCCQAQASVYLPYSRLVDRQRQTYQQQQHKAIARVRSGEDVIEERRQPAAMPKPVKIDTMQPKLNSIISNQPPINNPSNNNLREMFLPVSIIKDQYKKLNMNRNAVEAEANNVNRYSQMEKDRYNPIFSAKMKINTAIKQQNLIDKDVSERNMINKINQEQQQKWLQQNMDSDSKHQLKWYHIHKNPYNLLNNNDFISSNVHGPHIPDLFDEITKDQPQWIHGQFQIQDHGRRIDSHGDDGLFVVDEEISGDYESDLDDQHKIKQSEAHNVGLPKGSTVIEGDHNTVAGGEAAI